MKRNIRIAAVMAACAVTLQGCYVLPYDAEGKPFPVYPVGVPPNAQAPAMPATDQKVRITVAREDARNPASPVGVWIGEDRVPTEALSERLRLNPVVQRDHEAYLQADESVPYGSVVRVMGIMRAAGVTKLGIVTDPLVSQ